MDVRLRRDGRLARVLHFAFACKGGCFRCLRLADHKNYREERFKVLKEDPVRRLIGCTGFTPYGVAAPMHAATLATETILDWLQRDSPRPRFRTRSVASADVFEVKNQDFTRLAACPACGTNDVVIPAIRQRHRQSTGFWGLLRMDNLP